MNPELQTYHQEYLARTAKLAELNASIQKLETEAAELELMRKAADKRLTELEGGIANAQHDMAAGTLSTEQLLKVKREYYIEEADVKAFADAALQQSKALDILRENASNERRAMEASRNSIAKIFGDQAADEIATLTSETIMKLIYGFMLDGLRLDKAFRTKERFYETIGENICRRVLISQDNPHAKLPEIYEAKKHIDELIAALA